MLTIAENRPSYVTFELRAVEDRQASIEQGHYVVRDVPFAIVTPQGSKDRIERVADEWFAQLERQVADNRFPREWLQAYKAAFADWKAGNEPAADGTDLRNWPALSPAMLKACRELRLRTVEDIAMMNEESIARLGMGARSLKTRAQEWLASAESLGKPSEAIAALKAANEDLKLRNESLETRLAELEAKLAEPVRTNQSASVKL